MSSKKLKKSRSGTTQHTVRGKNPTIGEVGEVACIDRIRSILGIPRRTSSLAGIPSLVRNRQIITALTDDTAVVKISPKMCLLFSTDIINEGTEFFRDSDPEAIGYLAVMPAISDVAAKGTRPLAATVGWSIPSNLKMSAVEGIARGVRIASKKFGVPVLAGDLNESDQMIFSSTAIGFAAPGDVVLRRGASAGDYLAVSGTLGGYTAGYLVSTRGADVSSKVQKAVQRRFLWPEPRIDLACGLARHRLITSMIDLSDGLLTGAEQLVKANRGKLGVELIEENLPIMNEAVQVIEAAKENRDVLMSGEGGDYELMMTVKPHYWEQVQTIANKVNTPITKVGAITANNKIILRRRNGRLEKISEGGFHQFGSGRLRK